jgi:hypothetical protein
MFDNFEWLLTIPRVSWHIMSFDIAVDMGLSYDTVFMLKRDKREEFGTRGHSKTETRYLGALGNGHIKLYDKAKEQKLENVDWTRFEITVKKINHLTPTLDDFKEVCKVPTLYRKDVQMSLLDLNDTYRLSVEAILYNSDLLYTIKNYRTRKKIEQALSQCLEDIPVSVEKMYDTYIDYFAKLELDRLESLGTINTAKIFERQERDKKSFNKRLENK